MIADGEMCMDDFISRESAIEALKSLPTWWGDGGGWYGHAQPPMVALLDPLDAVNAIDNIPAADVRPVKRGKWLEYDDTEYFRAKCSLCGNWIDTRHGTNYCPNCGAQMEVEHG